MKKRVIVATMLACIVLAGCESTATAPAALADTEAAAEDKSIEEVADEPVELSAAGAVAPSEKEETVNVKAKADGSVESVKVSVKLKRKGSGTIKDKTVLSDIKNKEGDEEYDLKSDGTLLFEDHGEDISYEGVTEKALPVNVKVRYFLNGEEKTADEMAGQSGNVRIRFEYENNTSEESEIDGETVTAPVPFTVISAVMLSEDHFSDIEVENGELITAGDAQIAMGYAIPGLYDALSLGDYEDLEDTDIPEYVEIKAKADDFRIDYTATIISNGSFSDMEDEDIEDLDEFSADMKDLGKASGKISDALSKIAGGGSEFGEYLSSYTAGVDTLYSGINTLNTTLSAMDTSQLAALEAMDPAFAGLSANMEQLKASVAALNDGAAQLAASGTQLNGAYAELLNGINTLSSSYVKFDRDGIKKLSDAGGSDLKEILARVKALREADSSYDNYSGITEGTKGSVRFIIETAEIGQ